MNLLKRENYWFWIIMYFIGNGISMMVLGALLNVYDKDAWYANWKNWLIGLLLFVFPVFIMFAVFMIQITVTVAAKLNVPGKEIYLTPYFWIICLLIPIIGWFAMGALSLYLSIMIIIQLYNGEGEQYI